MAFVLSYSDQFTVGANANLDAYPAAGTWSMIRGASGELVVNAANDRVQTGVASSSREAEYIGSVITANQEIRATVYASSDGAQVGYVMARNTGVHNTYTFYYGYIDKSATNEVSLWRHDGTSGDTLLTDADRGLSGNGAHTARLRVITNPVTGNVEIEYQVDATAVVTFTDTSGSKLLTGKPGLGIYNDTANTAYIDNVEIYSFLHLPTPRRAPMVIDAWRLQ